MPKSSVRIKIEQAIEDSGIVLPTLTVFTDKSLSGWRIKYSGTFLKPKKMKRIRKQLRKQFPTQDFRIYNVDPQWTGGHGGVAIKIFN